MPYEKLTPTMITKDIDESSNLYRPSMSMRPVPDNMLDQLVQLLSTRTSEKITTVHAAMQVVPFISAVMFLCHLAYLRYAIIKKLFTHNCYVQDSLNKERADCHQPGSKTPGCYEDTR